MFTMYLFIIKALVLYFMCDSCGAAKLFKREVELQEIEDLSTKNESSFWSVLLQQQPAAILVELKAPLLERIKMTLDDENNSDAVIGQTILATFDSEGLREASFYNDTFELRQEIMALRPTVQQKEDFSPSIHALSQLLQGRLPQGSVLLVTMSKPSDEDFLDTLMRFLMEYKTQLSVLWMGDEETDDYFLLKDLTNRTGGKFVVAPNDSENILQSYFSDFSGNIKFPDERNQSSGEDMSLVPRVADQRVLPKLVVPLIVEVASGTSLETRPGTPLQIPFTVKNNINIAIPVFFRARYNGVPANVQPPQALLQPSATVTAIVSLQPIGAAQNLNAVGTITLFATAAEKVTARSAMISLTPQTITDNYAPKMTYKYEGDCSNYREPHNCENGHWSVEATFYDEDSGILKILSEPYGLLFQNEFVAGTKSPVTVYYSATCCQPIAHIWAEDLRGNYVRKTFDVFNQNLLSGEIASIVLGVLLLLFIIIAIIVAIVLIRRRNQRNLIIPRARSGSR